MHFFSDFSHTFFNFFLSFPAHTSLKFSSAAQFFGDGLEARRRTPSLVAPTASTLAARTSTDILRSMVGFIAWRTVYLRTGRRWHIGAGAGVPDTASDTGGERSGERPVGKITELRRYTLVEHAGAGLARAQG